MFLHLNPLYRKLIGKIVFEVNTPLSVGTGGQDMLRQVLRIGEKVVIPATTWKGAFRAIAERLAKTMDLKGVEGLAVLLYRETVRGIVYKPSDSDRRTVQNPEEWNKYLEEFGTALESKETETTIYKLNFNTIKEILNDIYAELDETVLKGKAKLPEFAERYLAYNCPIGCLFGNHVLAGKVRFFDTILDMRQTHIRPGVGIERSTGKVKENVLYFVESIPSGSEMMLQFIADNLLPERTDTILFYNTLGYIQKLGLQIGTRKSTGMGLLSVKNIQLRDIDLRSDADLNIIKPALG
jgi:CRISPR/Cas system CSM-associated protein Csm3 (group 7 of RAMP superfamily)